MDAVSESDTYIQMCMKQFKLVDMRECYHSLIEEAEKENMGYKEFLIKLLQAEQQGKKERNREKLRRLANFESIKTLDEIDYSFHPSLDRGKIDELGELSFIERNENVIIIGPPDVGKSMIATGIGINSSCVN